jgi:hypothetical protein
MTILEAVNEHFTFSERGRGKHKTHKVSIGTIEACGKSKAEATANLLKQVAKAVDAHYSPSFITFQGRHAIVYRTPCAWFCAFPQVDGRTSRSSGTGPYASRDEAEQQASLYLADLAGDGRAEKEPMMEHAEEKQEFRERRPRV